MRTDPLRCRPAWLMALLCFFVLMLALGSVPGKAQALSDRYGDKLLHMLAYGFMALLCYVALQAQALPRILTTIAVIALLGLFDECLQSFLPYRNASALDWCFDVGAAAVVAVLLTLHAHYLKAARPHA